MVHLIAVVAIAAACGLWAWLQLRSTCDGSGSKSCGDGGCGACKRDGAD